MAMSRPTQQHQQPPPPPPQLSQQPPQTTRYDLEVTIISGKHLKNVNWKKGNLKPYAIFWVDPDHKLTTKSDDSSDTKPVWNQRFTIPITTSPLSDSVFTLEVFHSKASETPKPFVGSLQVRLSSLPEPDNHTKLRSYDLLRPSGRAQGKIRLKLAVKELPFMPPPPPGPPPPQTLPDYQNTPVGGNGGGVGGGYYYSSAPPYPYASSRSATPVPPPPQQQQPPPTTAYPYSVGYYAGYYSPPPPPPSSVMRSLSERNMSYGAPSAPVDYSPYELRGRPGAGGGPGFGAGLGVGAVAGALGGLALDEGLKYEEEKMAERVEDNYLGSSSTKDDFSEYRADY